MRVKSDIVNHYIHGENISKYKKEWFILWIAG